MVIIHEAFSVLFKVDETVGKDDVFPAQVIKLCRSSVELFNFSFSKSYTLHIFLKITFGDKIVVEKDLIKTLRDMNGVSGE